MGILKDLKYKVRNNEKYALYLLIVITLILRSIFVLVIYSNIGTTNWSDDWYYISLGEQIAHGNWGPKSGESLNMIVGPGIPILIAFFIWIFSNPVVPFFIYNILASSLIVPVFYYLGKEMFNKNIGWSLAIWGILNIEFFKYTPHVLKETTIYLFLPLTLLFLIKSLKPQKYLNYLLLSILIFICLIHTDERFIVYFPFFALIFFITRPILFRKGIHSVAIWIGLVLLLMLPWSIRNYKVYGQLVLISPRTTLFTSKIWGKDISGIKIVNNKEKITSLDKPIVILSDTIINSSIISTKETREIGFYLKTFVNIWQPAYFKEQYLQYSWWPELQIQHWSLKHNIISIVFYGIFLPFYLIGLVFLILRLNLIGIFVGIIPFMHSILHTFMVTPEERYRYPIVFIIVMIGIWAGFELFNKIKQL